MNNAVFGETMENVIKHRDIKLVTTESRRKHLVSERNYHTSKIFTENFLAIEMKKTESLLSITVYLGILILELSKILMYEFWYDYVKANMVRKQNCVIQIQIKTDDIYKDIAEDVETRFDTSSYGLGRPLPKGKNKKTNWINER